MRNLIIRFLTFIIWLIGKTDNPEQREIKGVIYRLELSDKIIITGDIKMVELREGQKVKGRVKFLTAGGNPAAYEPGSVSATSSDDSVASVTFNELENEVEIEVEGLDGSANESVTIEVRADGKRGEGVREVVAAGTVIVTQGDAVTASIEFETPFDPTAATEAPEVPAEPGPDTEGGDIPA